MVINDAMGKADIAPGTHSTRGASPLSWSNLGAAFDVEASDALRTAPIL